jgi:hypothetical protein
VLGLELREVELGFEQGFGCGGEALILVVVDFASVEDTF